MGTLSQFDDSVYEIKRSFYHLIKHPYLDLYLADPEVDEDKIRFIYAMLQGHLPNKDVELYTISTLLVQAALDIHEAIPLHNVTAKFERKKGQLEILAGDYYSSLYYYFLARNNQLPMIQVFSHTIQEINEFKMNIYHSATMEYEEVEKNVMLIESVLLQEIASAFNLTGWREIMNDFFYLRRLLIVRNEWSLGKEHPITHALLKEVSENEMLDRIDQIMEGLQDRLLRNSKRIRSFEAFVTEFVDELMRRTSSKEKIIEER